jgi:hypothetical protein
MLQIVNLVSGNVIAEYAQTAAAETYLASIETTPPTHEITGEPETAPEVEEIG